MDGMNVSTMLKRLEAAASRLEDVVMFAEMQRSPEVPTGPLVVDDTASNAGASTDSLRSPSMAPSSASHQVSPRSSAPLVVVNAPPLPDIDPAHNGAGYAALAAVKQQRLAEFVKLSSDIAEGVDAQAKAFAEAFDKMLEIVALAETAAKPAMEEFMTVLQPMNAAAGKVEDLRNEFRKERELANFLATVPAGVGALGWVTIEGKNQAGPFVGEMKDSAQFYGNRVLKDNKEHKAWVDAYIGVLTDLAQVVKEKFPEGLQWNAKGKPAGAPAAPGAAPGAPATGGAAPPPPPPPPSIEQLTADTPASAAAKPAADAGGMGGVFAELSQGESIASGLKPVDRKALKASKPPIPKATKPKPRSAGDSAPPASSAAAPAASAGAAKLRPRVELVESTWYIEDLRNRHDIEIEAGMGQSIQIDNCAECTLKIAGKAATFNMSRCTKIGLLVETMVASCDIVNCTSFGLQVTGQLPSLMIDQSSQGSIYLSKESLDVDIFTSQTTTINVNIPEDEPGAYREVPLGEQIVHNLVNGGVKSTVVKHA